MCKIWNDKITFCIIENISFSSLIQRHQRTFNVFRIDLLIEL